MPKLIDYPRTNYTGAWELAEITDDTGGKCTIENAARKLNRKVSGSFKAIIGSAVKFGLVISKRELLTTTTLFKRIKHAYDKQEELVFHREAFLTPPLFTQICRKFRSRELPVQMLDVMLIREFGVEEINAQGVAKAFVDGCRMVGLLDENNIIADIDAFSTKQVHRHQLSSPIPEINVFRPDSTAVTDIPYRDGTQQLALKKTDNAQSQTIPTTEGIPPVHNDVQKIAAAPELRVNGTDAIATLFGFTINAEPTRKTPRDENHRKTTSEDATVIQNNSYRDNATTSTATIIEATPTPSVTDSPTTYQVRISGPGISTELDITEREDITLAIALLEKIRRQLKD